ncbi:hypothetical protein HF325_001050 [Metschnikowia pulcherrima]|uniref:HAT C-terminal dimerisation domain-containing protein n=1 Tax=Metschnikowia pulcherrima TaxID=27326 RepID=A0A8H7GVA3_9ASCO|nr:hypothetical protein HF325_001050 [Metschnikowia pulcherrima]
MAQEATKSGKPKEETILGTSLLDGLTGLPTEITDYFKVDKSKSKRLSGNRLDRPSYANCSPRQFKKIFTQFLIGANIPFNVCDEFLTKRMVDAARFGLLTTISRGQMMRLLKKLYSRQVKKMKAEFKEHDGRFALTMDEWKASNDNYFLGITVHFFTDLLELKRYNIGLEHIPKKGGNADSLANSLFKVLTFYGIEDRIISISRDNASVMDKVIRLFKTRYEGKGVDDKFDGDIRCFGHITNLSVRALMAHAFPHLSKTAASKDSMEESNPAGDNNPIDDTLFQRDDTPMEDDEIFASLPADVKAFPDKVRKFIRSVHKNDLLGALFDLSVAKRKQTDNSKKEKLKKENLTRWLSEYEMIDSFLYFKEQIIDVYTEFGQLSRAEQTRIGVSEITASDWKYLEVLRDILHIFVEPTKSLQGSTYATIQETIPCVHALLEEIREVNTESLLKSHPSISEGLTAAYDKLYKYFPIYEEECGQLGIYYIATVLDPSYKLSFFETEKRFPQILSSNIKKKLEAIYQLYKLYYGEERQKLGEILKGISSTVRTSGNFRHLKRYKAIRVEANEIETYLKEEKENAEVVDFYRTKKGRNPILFQVAKDILAIPAMSAPAESLFSILGDIVTKKRNKLYPATTKMLAVVKDMVKKIGPDDIELGVDSDDESFVDDPELCSQITQEMNESESDDAEMEVDSNENNAVCILLDE